jgi:hypothetical protein
MGERLLSDDTHKHTAHGESSKFIRERDKREGSQNGAKSNGIPDVPTT